MTAELMAAVKTGMEKEFKDVFPSTQPPVPRVIQPNIVVPTVGGVVVPTVSAGTVISWSPFANMYGNIPVSVPIPTTVVQTPQVPNPQAVTIPQSSLAAISTAAPVSSQPSFPSTAFQNISTAVPLQVVVPPVVSTQPIPTTQIFQPMTTGNYTLPPLASVPNVTSGSYASAPIVSSSLGTLPSVQGGVVPYGQPFSVSMPQEGGVLPRKTGPTITIAAETSSNVITTPAPQSLSVINAYMQTPSIDRVLAELKQEDIVSLLKIKHTKEGGEKVTSEKTQKRASIQELAAKLNLPPNLSDTDRQCYLLALLKSINRI